MAPTEETPQRTACNPLEMKGKNGLVGGREVA